MKIGERFLAPGPAPGHLFCEGTVVGKIYTRSRDRLIDGGMSFVWAHAKWCSLFMSALLAGDRGQSCGTACTAATEQHVGLWNMYLPSMGGLPSMGVLQEKAAPA